MLFTNTKFLSFLAAAAAVKGAPIEDNTIEARAIVPHDSINPWPENVPGGNLGNTLRKFEPYLHIAHGCQPYSAVDGYGNVSGGLQDTGNVSAGCRDQSKGQTYVRGGWSGGKYGIMYAWYFPKDHPAAGNLVSGHRHDWEHVVVWVNNPEVANPQMLGGAASGHGNAKGRTTLPTEGTRPKVEYFTERGLNHALQFTNTLGKDYPMMWYEFLPAASKQVLDLPPDQLFKSANVPFSNGNFANNLKEAQV